MAEDGRRPGGLTALAVLNFVFGGFGALGVLALLALVGVADAETKGEVTRASSGMVWVLILMTAVSVGLMITSGVGYLGQRKFLGRTLGTAYAIVSLVGTAVSFAFPESKFGIGTVIGLVYPVLTLVLLNTTFKDDLVR